jgi:KRAB domain-containing zinc finger protein
MRLHVIIHLKSENRPKNLECDFCSKLFYTKSHLRTHMMTRHVIKERLFKCNQCLYSAKIKYCLARHMTTHNKHFKCTKCDQVFSQKHYLAVHLKRHELPEEFVCHCKKTFKSSGALNYHKIKLHKEKPTEDRAFKCKTCDYAGTTTIAIKRHQATHVKQFKCHNCNKGFSTNKMLQVHLNYEPTNRYYCFKDLTCKICEKVCANREKLTQHSRSHAERVQCPICQQFFGAIYIKVHIKSHKIKSQEPKFKCEFCPKAFHFIELLRSHDGRIHNKKVFICDFCGHKVHSKSKLAPHFKFHFENTNLKCQLCRVVFSTEKSLNNHKTRYHSK